MIVYNPYKRRNVFKCSQDAHHAFNGQVSAYHVLKEKKCYPDGCIYFIWHCVRKEKGLKCVHKYNYIGKNCRGCTHFIEDKVHLQPVRLMNEATYTVFEEELQAFDTWLEDTEFRSKAIAGRIRIVKPWFENHRIHQSNHFKLRGYLLVFHEGFIGLDNFKDSFYIRITDSQMREYQFIPKMKIECVGEIRQTLGRIIIHKPGQFTVLTRGWGRPWNRERALVAIRTASRLSGQPDQCHLCPWGALVDCKDFTQEKERRYRELYCLQGIDNPEGCYIHGLWKHRKKKVPV